MSTVLAPRRRIIGFPNPVNEVAARVVATGVVLLCTLFLVTGWTWVVAILAYGFVARVLTGPRLSPLGLLATKVVAPRLTDRPKLVPGPPKRFAQSIGATLSTLALVAAVAGWTGLAMLLVGAITIAAFLEAALALCLGCTIFGALMRAGVIPTSMCESCNDLSVARR
jgi:hypothetical protein